VDQEHTNGRYGRASQVEDTKVINFFGPPRGDFLLGGKCSYMSEG